MHTWLRKSATRSVAALGAVAALAVSTAVPAGAATEDPPWVVSPQHYWTKSSCLNSSEAMDVPGAGYISYVCYSGPQDELTVWIKGKPHPMTYSGTWTYGWGSPRHWVDYDCLSPGTPMVVEGSVTSTGITGWPTYDDPQEVTITQRVSEWGKMNELFRHSALPARCGNPSVFTDIGPGDTFYEHIHWAARNGITNGWKDGTYRPHATITRDVMAAYLARWGNIPTVNKFNGENNSNIDRRRWDATIPSTYSDMPPARRFSVEVSLLSQIGVINGWADGTFRPDQNVTRDQTAAFLYRLAGSPAYTPPKTPRFKDVRPGAVFYKEISWLADSGFSTGWSDGTFRPGASIHRDEMAAILHRFEKVYSGVNRGDGIVK